MPYKDSLGQPAGYEDDYGPVGFSGRPDAPVPGRSHILPRQQQGAVPMQQQAAAPSLAMDAVLNKFGGSMDAYNRWWQGLAGNKPTDWNQALQMMGEGPGDIQSPVSGGVMGALQLGDFPTRNPVADNISMGPEDPGQGGMTMPTAASGYGTMSSQMGYEGMPAPQMGGDGIWPQMQATHTEPVPGSGGSRYPMDLSGSPGVISGQGPVGGMSMPQGASGYGTMSSQMGEPGATYPMGIGRHLSADYGFGPLDALKRKAQERTTASQRFQSAAQKLNR